MPTAFMVYQLLEGELERSGPDTRDSRAYSLHFSSTSVPLHVRAQKFKPKSRSVRVFKVSPVGLDGPPLSIAPLPSFLEFPPSILFRIPQKSSAVPSSP